MPKLSPTGHVAGGVDGSEVFVDGEIVDLGGGVAWMTDEKILYQATDGHDRWWLRTYNRVTREHGDLDSQRGANQVIAGGDRWAAYLDTGVRGSLGPEMPLAGLRDGGADGTLALVDNIAVGRGVTLYAPDGTVRRGAADSPCEGLRVLGPDDAIYIRSGTWGEIVTLKRRRFKQIGDAMSPALLTIAGEDWICYFNGAKGIVAHPAYAPADPRPLLGYVLGPAEDAHWWDVCAVGSAIRITYSKLKGERLRDAVTRDVPLADVRQDLQAPIVPPAPPPIVVPPPVVVPPPIVIPPAYVDPARHRGLNAGNCADLLGDVWMREMADRGITLTRRDGCLKPPTKAQLEAVDAECWRVGIRPLYLGGQPLMRQLGELVAEKKIPTGTWFEFWMGTNPGPGDTGGASVSGTQYGREAIDVLDYCEAHGLRAWLGVLDNLTDAWLGPGNFLYQMVRSMGPAQWARVKDFTAHWYPNDYEDAGVGHDGRATTQADVDYLRSKIGPDRNVLFTEAGFHNAPRRVHVRLFGINLWKRTIRGLAELEVLARVRQFDGLCARQKNLVGWIGYQLVDAEKAVKDYDTPINRYGWREAMKDGARWKAQSNLWR